jgi:hypothetical protein
MAFCTIGDGRVPDGAAAGETASSWFVQRAQSLTVPSNYIFTVASVAAATAALKNLPSNVKIDTLYFDGHGFDTEWYFSYPRTSSSGLKDPTLTVSLNQNGFNAEFNGSTYTAPPTLKISGGDGTGADVSVNTSGIFTLNNGGSGYTSAPTVTVSGGTYTGGTKGMTVTYSWDNLPQDSAAFTNELARHLNQGFKIFFLACHCGNGLAGMVAKALSGKGVNGTVNAYTHVMACSKQADGTWESWLEDESDQPLNPDVRAKNNQIVKPDVNPSVTR